MTAARRQKTGPVPRGSVNVGYRTVFANPFARRAGGERGLATSTREMLADEYRQWLTAPTSTFVNSGGEIVVQGPGGYRDILGVPWADRELVLGKLPQLRGKDLYCECSETQPCHADVLLDLANSTEGTSL